MEGEEKLKAETWSDQGGRYYACRMREIRRPAYARDDEEEASCSRSGRSMALGGMVVERRQGVRRGDG